MRLSYRSTSSCAAAQVHLAGNIDQLGHVQFLERNRVALAQDRQVGQAAVVGGDHGQAGQAAFRGFGLVNDRQALAAGQIEVIQETHDALPATMKKGSNILSIMGRRSIQALASTRIPDCKTSFLS